MPRLSTMIGQDAAIARLRKAIANAALGHAYLFAGPAGVGKTATARALAKALNCDEAGPMMGAGDSCEICPACRQSDAGSHPDIHLVRPSLIESEGAGRRPSVEILIDQVREMNRMISLSPSVGRRKVFIVTPAEAMNEQAQNALLKSLEEPPALSTIILCAESAESLLPTIQSRCQVIPFGLAPRALIELRLRELFGLTPEEARVTAALSQGRVGVAIRLARDPGWREARTRLLDMIEQAISGDPLGALRSAIPLREQCQKVPVMIDALGGGAQESASDRVAGRIQLQMLFEEIATIVRDLMVLHLEGGEDLVVNLDRKDSLARLAKSRASADWRRALTHIMSAQDLLRRNVNTQLLIEDVLLDLTWTG
ncbi:MAG TPA: DNA polymerase III subunit delta' [Armatimonadota bacterium]|nr:DNA polymerase III subunit delta' [Armatimonadota bacterium]